MPRKAVTGGTGKRVALNMKTTEDVRARLEEAAAASGRSLTAEVEHRLEMSFDEDAIRDRIDALQQSLLSATSPLNKIKSGLDESRATLDKSQAILNEARAIAQTDLALTEERIELAVARGFWRVLASQRGTPVGEPVKVTVAVKDEDIEGVFDRGPVPDEQ